LKPTLEVLIPAYNEADVLALCFARLSGVLERLDVRWRVLFVDDGSTDGTWALI